MYQNGKILVGKNDQVSAYILPKMANRHGLITGATGTGKTVSVKVLTESFSAAGVPVFVVDVKGDLAGTACMGSMNENISSRVEKLKLDDFRTQAFPVVFLDTYGHNGHPMRTSVQALGHRLISKMLQLSDAQDSVLAMIYKIAADENMPLYDLADLQAMLTWVSNNRGRYSNVYGNLPVQTLTTIQRRVVELRDQVQEHFFGTPIFKHSDLRAIDADTGMGRVTMLDAQELFGNPTSYVAMVLWLLNDLFENLPEVGDLDKPKLIFFFDEAHLLFSQMPQPVIDQVIKVVKLIRSKGVGLYFISQSPADIPNEVLAQLGNKIQHGLHAYTPSEQRAIKAAADGLRPNPDFDTKQALQNLGTGEALVSFIDEKGQPTITQKVTVLPPQSQMGPIDEDTRRRIINSSPLAGVYDHKTQEKSARTIVEAEMATLRAEQDRLKQETESAKLEAAKLKEEARLAKEKAKLEREQERARKNSLSYKLTSKVVNKATNKVIDKSLNKMMSGIFGTSSKKSRSSSLTDKVIDKGLDTLWKKLMK